MSDLADESTPEITVTELSHDVATQIEAQQVSMTQAAAVKVSATEITARQAASAVVSGERATLEGSSVGVAVSKGDVSLDHSIASAVGAQGDVTMDGCITAAVVANTVQAKDCETVFLLAKRVEGDPKPQFSIRETLLLGAAAGATFALAAFLIPKAVAAFGALMLPHLHRRGGELPAKDAGEKS